MIQSFLICSFYLGYWKLHHFKCSDQNLKDTLNSFYIFHPIYLQILLYLPLKYLYIWLFFLIFIATILVKTFISFILYCKSFLIGVSATTCAPHTKSLFSTDQSAATIRPAHSSAYILQGLPNLLRGKDLSVCTQVGSLFPLFLLNPSLSLIKPHQKHPILALLF